MQQNTRPGPDQSRPAAGRHGREPVSRRAFCRTAAAGVLLPVLGAPARRPGPIVGPESLQETDMITIRKSQERGHADHGWLDTYHTFSFASYHDPEWVHFGPLRVINQDRVEPGQGFGTHGHEDMEIVTYVLEGVLEHADSMGNGSQMRPGEVQLMSAGTGVTHSEFNASREEGLHLLQMWVFPAQRGTQPSYEQKSFPPGERQGRLRLVVSPDGSDGSLTIGQDARLYVGLLASGEQTEQRLPAGRAAWLHVARGRVELNGHSLGPGDGAGIRDEAQLVLRGVEDAELVLWELPSDWSPR